MRRLVILMYHALFENRRDWERIAPEDRPYAVSAGRFGRQLDLLLQRGLPIVDPRRLERDPENCRGVVLTFDDGHASGAELALPVLRQRGVKAAFFLTTGFIGSRPEFCTWRQVAELSEHGMTIGGHGHSHRFLSELPAADARSELQRSRLAISERLAGAPLQMSFPGGRFDAATVELARQAGYRVLHGSRVGSCTAGVDPLRQVLPRIAIRAQMTDTLVAGLAAGRAADLLPMRAAAGVKHLIRRALGNERYHLLYAKFKSQN